MEFVDYSYENLIRLAPVIRNSPLLCSDVSLGAFLMWHEGLDMKFALHQNTLVVRLNYGDEVAFSYPFGENVDAMFEQLFAYVKENKFPLMFFGISEERMEEMKADPRFSGIRTNYDRRWSDYLYSFEEMRTFVGKKFSGQRNHINRFKKTYGEPDFRPISEEDIPNIQKMLEEYGQNHHSGDAMEEKELKGTCQLLQHFKELGMYGGVLYVGGKVASFTIGEVVGDRLIIHVEKGLTQFLGVYPTTYHCFVNYMYEQLGDTIHLVNREDDAGDMGLRTSKSQYQPVRLLHKYLVNVGTPIAAFDTVPEICFDGGKLDAITEADKETYLAICTDKENNRYWGYDYEQDRYIGEVDENTFFNSQAYDFSIGASITFAVRDDVGSMIGEAIVYHFNYAGTAEIGGRIVKTHQGKGYGTKAFTAAADFAQEFLQVTPVAKCYKPNEASAKMILNSGFRKTGEDADFYYFSR